MNKLIKVCRHCHREKESTEFAPHPTTKDKLQVWCHDCRRKYALQKYKDNAAKSNARRLALYYANKNIVPPAPIASNSSDLLP